MTTPARRAAARKTVAYLRQQSGQSVPRLPPFAELLELGEAYVAEVGDGNDGAFRRTLGESGQLYVTLESAQAYGAFERLDDERARLELTELLLDAKESAGNPGQWRFRRASAGVDLTARIRSAGKLLIVSTVSVRPFNSGGGRG